MHSGNISQILTAFPFGDSVHVTLAEERIEESLYDHLRKAGITNVTIEETTAGIEDRFLELMEKGVTA